MLPIQLREGTFRGKRPLCPRGCPGKVHRHGRYSRYANPEGDELEWVQRYRCWECRLSLSVLQAHRLPYRAVRAERLEREFDRRAGIQSQSLDPPPRAIEAGCLQRAWSRWLTRTSRLKDAFGQLVCSTVSEGGSLWVGLRQAMNSVTNMLSFLGEHHFISLLGNYRCLRPPACA